MAFAPIVPELYVSDFERSLRFYTDVLGFLVEYEREQPRFAFLSFEQKGGLMLQQREDGDEWITGDLQHPFGRGINFQIETRDVERLLAAVLERGIPLVRGLKDSWYEGGDTLFGCREFIIQDPDGYMLRFSQPLGRKPAGEHARGN